MGVGMIVVVTPEMHQAFARGGARGAVVAMEKIRKTILGSIHAMDRTNTTVIPRPPKMAPMVFPFQTLLRFQAIPVETMEVVLVVIVPMVDHNSEAVALV